MDLHSSNVYVGIVNQAGEKVTGLRLPCRLKDVLEYLSFYKNDIVTIAVESTFNWYWLVDGMIADGYNVVLANPGAMKQYSGLKHTNDKTDAFFIAELLRLDILPTGHIYPLKMRAVRDLLRRRQTFVHQKTTHILSIKSAIMRSCALSLSRSAMQKLKLEDIDRIIPDNEILNFTLKRSLEMIQFIKLEIKVIEDCLMDKISLHKEFLQLKTAAGIGKILGMTIMLETGNIDRFAKVGNYTSYCRCTSSKCSSNGKTKGKNNAKNGNKYLSWALVEVATQAIIHYPEPNKFYQRKKARRNSAVAIKAIAAKMSKAIYYMLKNDQPFDMKRVFP